MDAGTGLSILGGAIGSAKLVEKLLGPTADYLGEGIKDYTQKGLSNVARIFKTALRCVGSRIEEPGQVNPKVLRAILTEGYFCEDELSAEYFGGVLASSRSSDSSDDRGAYFIGILSGMSFYQIRGHYILYWLLRRAFLTILAGEDSYPFPSLSRGIVVDLESYLKMMGGTLSLEKNIAQDFLRATLQSEFDLYCYHVLDGLQQKLLLTNKATFEYSASGKNLQDSKGTLTAYPSYLGIQLFLWCHGQSDKSIGGFYNPLWSVHPLSCVDIDFEKIQCIDI